MENHLCDLLLLRKGEEPWSAHEHPHNRISSEIHQVGRDPLQTVTKALVYQVTKIKWCQGSSFPSGRWLTQPVEWTC